MVDELTSFRCVLTRRVLKVMAMGGGTDGRAALCVCVCACVWISESETVVACFSACKTRGLVVAFSCRERAPEQILTACKTDTFDPCKILLRLGTDVQVFRGCT